MRRVVWPASTLAVLVVCGRVVAGSGAPARVHAIVGARVVVAPGKVIDQGTVVVRDGLIAAVGADVTARPDARSWPFAYQWSASLRGDIGGFGVGSDFAWQAMAVLRWQFSPRTGVALAYRYLDMDYEDGQGESRFLYDMATSGPALGVVFTF